MLSDFEALRFFAFCQYLSHTCSLRFYLWFASQDFSLSLSASFSSCLFCVFGFRHFICPSLYVCHTHSFPCLFAPSLPVSLSRSLSAFFSLSQSLFIFPSLSPPFILLLLSTLSFFIHTHHTLSLYFSFSWCFSWMSLFPFGCHCFHFFVYRLWLVRFAPIILTKCFIFSLVSAFPFVKGFRFFSLHLPSSAFLLLLFPLFCFCCFLLLVPSPISSRLVIHFLSSRAPFPLPYLKGWVYLWIWRFMSWMKSNSNSTAKVGPSNMHMWIDVQILQSGLQMPSKGLVADSCWPLSWHSKV